MPRPKARTVFVCDDCGNETPKWEGRCPACRNWNTLVEVRMDKRTSRDKTWLGTSGSPAQQLSKVSIERLSRLQFTSVEVNRVLGGGIVPGSLALLAGDPGIGKSTLLLRMAGDVSVDGGKTLYVSGEESASQVKMRADRLGIPGDGLYLLSVTNLEDVISQLESDTPSLVVVDSIQTMYDDALSAEAGSVAQIRGCTRRLTEWAKDRNVPVILSGHVTKSGDIAGPRVLEHMVDVVLYMEGESISSWRLLRTVKNRFGSTNEVGVFEMTGLGLRDVEDPSKAFLSERLEGAIGSVIISTQEGTRPMLVEIQALTTPSVLPTPRRVATGIDFNRLLLVCAVLTRRAGIALSNQDIVVNVAGGLKVSEPAADLGLALAIASSFLDRPIRMDVAAVGEVGLSGEIRRVPQIDRRVREVARLGLKSCMMPASSETEAVPDGFEAIPVRRLADAMRTSFPEGHRQAIRSSAE